MFTSNREEIAVLVEERKPVLPSIKLLGQKNQDLEKDPGRTKKTTKKNAMEATAKHEEVLQNYFPAMNGVLLSHSLACFDGLSDF